MLLVFCILITSKQFFGDPVECYGAQHLPSSFLNTYCWNYGTFTLKNAIKGKKGSHFTQPGIGPSHDKELVHHTYYQWVCFVLLGQAAMFYIPRYLWRSWEGGRLKALASDLAGPITPEKWDATRERLVEYFSRGNTCCHMLYVVRYCFCEILNLINVICQMYLLNIFLGGAFINYGVAVATFNAYIPAKGDVDLDNITPMDKYFPKVTTCYYHEYGPSGSIMRTDYICVLSLNILNEKIFVVLWFWLLILGCLSALSVLYRLLTFSLTPVRMFLIMGQVRFVKHSHVCKVVRSFNFGDWFVLHLLGKNMNPRIFKEFIVELVKKMDNTVVKSVEEV